MAGEMRFRSRVSSTAVTGHVTEVFALVGMHMSLDETRGRYLRQYTLAYDFVNVKRELVAETIQKKIIEAAEEMGCTAAPFMASERDKTYRGAEIRDWKDHRAVVGVREVSDEGRKDTPFYSLMILGGFIRNEVVDTAGGREFAESAEKIPGRVIDKLFGRESMDDIHALVRKSNPGYIQ